MGTSQVDLQGLGILNLALHPHSPISDQIFNGDVAGINLFSRALNAREVSAQYSARCGNGKQGDVLGWEQFQDGIVGDKTTINRPFTDLRGLATAPCLTA